MNEHFVDPVGLWLFPLHLYVPSLDLCLATSGKMSEVQ